MKNVAIVALVDGERRTRVVSFPEGMSLPRDRFVRVVWEEGGKAIGRLLTDTMVLNVSAYSELCKLVNPLGTRIEYRATAEVQMAEKPFDEEIVIVERPKRVLRGQLDTFYGNVGEPAKLKDKFGVHLFVGDVVHLFDADGDYIGKEFVVKDEGGKAFVMGIKGACVQPGRKIDLGFGFYRYKRYNQVEDGEEYASVRMVSE